jgi:hypothetical protein
MEQHAEVAFADEARQLVVGAEVGRGERGKRRGVEAGRLSDGGHQLSATVDEERAARLRVVQEALQGNRDGPEVVSVNDQVAAPTGMNVGAKGSAPRSGPRRHAAGTRGVALRT